jgi:DNA ligase (NAD+)
VVSSSASIFTTSPAQLTRLAGWGPQRARSLATEIDHARRVPLDRFLIALSIPRVGPVVTHAVAHQAHSLQRLQRMSGNELAKIPGVGRAAAYELAEFLHAPRGRTLIDSLLRAGVVPIGA